MKIQIDIDTQSSTKEELAFYKILLNAVSNVVNAQPQRDEVQKRPKVVDSVTTPEQRKDEVKKVIKEEPPKEEKPKWTLSALKNAMIDKKVDVKEFKDYLKTSFNCDSLVNLDSTHYDEIAAKYKL